MARTIPLHESMTVEFKSDRMRLQDEDLILAVVCLANSEGDDLYIGVEDDGTITGLHPEHRDATSLAAFIANRTVPPVSVRASVLDEDGTLVARIEVPRSLRLVASSRGTLQRRRLTAQASRSARRQKRPDVYLECESLSLAR